MLLVQEFEVSGPSFEDSARRAIELAFLQFGFLPRAIFLNSRVRSGGITHLEFQLDGVLHLIPVQIRDDLWDGPEQSLTHAYLDVTKPLFERD